MVARFQRVEIGGLGQRARLAYVAEMAVPNANDRLPPDEPAQRMQRIRVGATGMAAVLLFVVLATALVGVLRPPAPAAGSPAANAAIATAAADNANDAEPLAQLGAAPGGKVDVANKPSAAKQ